MIHVHSQKFAYQDFFWKMIRCFVDFKGKCACYQKDNRSSRLKDCRKALGVELLQLRRLEALGINEKVNKFDFACGGLAASLPV